MLTLTTPTLSVNIYPRRSACIYTFMCWSHAGESLLAVMAVRWEL